MKKTLIFAALGALLFLPAFSRGLDVQMRLSSGLWRMDLAEVNTALADWNEGMKRTADVDPGMEFVSGTGGQLHLGVDFEAELVLSFSRWIKLGLSAGFAQSSLDEEATLITIDQGGILYEYARPTKVSAFPVMASGYFNLPLTRKLNVYLRAGAGWVQARYVSREAQKKGTETRFAYPVYDNTQAGRLTYLGGLGLSYSFDQSLGFFIEAAAKFARVDGFSGENKPGEKGILYFYEEDAAQSGVWESKMHVLPEAPTGQNIRNVHEAVVDFGGYSIKIGVLLKL